MNLPMRISPKCVAFTAGIASLVAALVAFSPPATSQTFAAKVTGPITSQSITVTVSPSSADTNRVGNVYIAANSGTWYAHNGTGWVPWNGGEFPSHFSGALTSKSSTVVSNENLSPFAFAGTGVYAGIGFSRSSSGANQDPFADMINNSRYTEIHRLGIFSLAIPSFGNRQTIPLEYICDGSGTIPEISWANVPSRAQSLALVVRSGFSYMTDSQMTTNGIVYNISTTATGADKGTLQTLGILGTPSGRSTASYVPPCTNGQMTTFTLYALSAPLNSAAPLSQSQFDSYMQGVAILGTARLEGTISR